MSFIHFLFRILFYTHLKNTREKKKNYKSDVYFIINKNLLLNFIYLGKKNLYLIISLSQYYTAFNKTFVLFLITFLSTSRLQKVEDLLATLAQVQETITVLICVKYTNYIILYKLV